MLVALAVPIVTMVAVRHRFQAEYSAAIWLGDGAIALAAPMFREHRALPRTGPSASDSRS